MTRRAAKFGAAGVVLVLGCGFFALGCWQLERREWKLQLMARVAARVGAAAVAAPGRADWPYLTRENAEYRHVVATGIYRPGRSVRVQAVTERGPGFWLLAPLEQPDGTSILVNRGFVAAQWQPPDDAGAEQRARTVSGLLRLTEPGGAFLRNNDPATDHWYSRDVAAIARAHGWSPIAPYFIDAGADAADPDGMPVGGLTVIAFHNNHLVYAITWYTLALVCAVGLVIGIREDRRRRPTA